MQTEAGVVAVGSETGLVLAFAKGSVVGFLGVLIAFCGVALALGINTGSALAIGLFTACWGGPGFGGMLGAIMHHNRTAHP